MITAWRAYKADLAAALDADERDKALRLFMRLAGSSEDDIATHPSEFSILSIASRGAGSGLRACRIGYFASMSSIDLGFSEPERVAERYFEAWKSGDVERVRLLLDDDVDFVGSLGTAHGVTECLAGLKGMFAMTEHVDVVKRWVNDEDVLTWFELTTAAAGPLPIVNWSTVVDGRITRIRVTFDPRPIVAG